LLRGLRGTYGGITVAPLLPPDYFGTTIAVALEPEPPTSIYIQTSAIEEALLGQDR